MAHLAALSSFDSLGPPSGRRIDPVKVEALGRGTKHDICSSTSTKRRVEGTDGIGDVLRGGLCHSFTGSGRCVSLFKSLYTNACPHDCRYRSNASCSDCQSFTCKSAPE